MSISAFDTAVQAVDWNSNVVAFCTDAKRLESIQRGCHLVAVWNQELSFQNSDSPALPFLQEMKSSLFYTPTCMSLGLYKPAASSMRAAVENALYYSYFVDHLAELRTLVEDDSYYISKTKIVEYHNAHTKNFRSRQRAIGFVSELESWYSRISAIVHGQIPGVWSSTSLARTSLDQANSSAAFKEFQRAISIINFLFLLTTDAETWEGFSSASRQLLLKGLSGQKKAVLEKAVV